MKIIKPYNFILYKKYPDKYFDYTTDQEFPYDQINEHPAWYKIEYDNNGNEIYAETNSGDWSKWEYDEYGNEIYFEDSNGYWKKWEYDTASNVIYYENSDGEIIDNTTQQIN